MSVYRLLDRLERVSQHGTDRWRAICPAHPSRHRTQSLAIRALQDGTLLIHCHAGCGAIEVVQALGLELRDLFAHGNSFHSRPPQKPGHWHAMRECVQTLHHEVLVVALAAVDVAEGRSVTVEDAARVAVAAARIRAALEACL
jgi:hypothetical protein